MLSDIEIAQQNRMEKIQVIANKCGLTPDEDVYKRQELRFLNRKNQHLNNEVLLEVYDEYERTTSTRDDKCHCQVHCLYGKEIT